MLRHAQMPKGSRRAPTSTDGFILGPCHTAQWVGLLFKGAQSQLRPARRIARRLSPHLFLLDWS